MQSGHKNAFDSSCQRERVDMEKGRLAAFSDGAIAIIITIMVLKLKVPHTDNLAALRPLIPAFLSYILSFIYLEIYWNRYFYLYI
jgi:uncharacterized membrane protein